MWFWKNFFHIICIYVVYMYFLFFSWIGKMSLCSTHIFLYRKQDISGYKNVLLDLLLIESIRKLCHHDLKFVFLHFEFPRKGPWLFGHSVCGFLVRTKEKINWDFFDSFVQLNQYDPYQNGDSTWKSLESNYENHMRNNNRNTKIDPGSLVKQSQWKSMIWRSKLKDKMKTR